MATVVTPPVLQGPTAKERRYDRQLRLWAANGQKALEAAHVLLLNSCTGVVGVEILKNLVLPGIGSFTIVDEKIVTEEDLGVNFFLEEESLGKSRTVEATRLLRELNPEVRGIAISQSPELWLANSDLSQYALILVIGPTSLDTVLRKVSGNAQRRGIPVIFVESIGFYARFSIQLPELFPIVETHPDPESTQDLRLVQPWPELLEHMHSKTANLESMSDPDHGHVPWLLLLLYYLHHWKAEHGSYPNVYKDKTAFRALVAAGARTSNSEGGEENYDEAVAAVLKSLNPPSIPSGLKEIFSESECQHPTSASSNFWLLAHSLAGFVQKNGLLPLPGSIPDMKAQSSDYIALQKIYRAKAQADLTAMTIALRKLEEDLNRAPMDSREIEQFCKGAATLKLIRGRPIALPAIPNPQAKGEVHVDWAGREATVVRELEDSESAMPIYVALAALDAGLHTSAVSHDQEAGLALFKQEAIPASVKQAADAMLASLKAVNAEFDHDAASERVDMALAEVARSGPVELHNTAALAGGIVAQEAIKIITKQYVPADNTVLWDGVSSKVGLFRL